MGKIVVTGLGIISAIGNSLIENHHSLVNNLSGISLKGNYPSKYSGILPVGQINLSDQELIQKLQIDKNGLTRTTLLAMQALGEALSDARWGEAEITSARTALIGGTTVGGSCLTDQLYRDAGGNAIDKSFLSSYDFASVFLAIQKHYNINGIINTINTACSSSANAIMYGCRLIKNGFADRAIVGGVDALSKFAINGFNSLRILSEDNCKPFDKNRNGLNLGEGAAFLILEKEEEVKKEEMYAEISGYQNSTDAFHPSSLSPAGEGPFLSMQGALKAAGLNPESINYINAHGTGTENNDEAESNAMKSLFEIVPFFSSTKGFTGHTLGAASAMEAVYSILSITYQEIYKNIGFENNIDSSLPVPVSTFKKTEINHVMSNSFGFGGNCSSIIFSKR